MIRFAIPLLAAAAMAPGVQAAEVQIASQGPVVELTVNEIVHRAPDVAQIGAGVSTRAPTAKAAVQMNAQAMDKLIAQLRELASRLGHHVVAVAGESSERKICPIAETREEAPKLSRARFTCGVD